MDRIEEIHELGEKILNHWALTDTKQLGLQACAIAAKLSSENTRLTAELQAAWKQLHEEIEKERKAVAERDAAIKDLSELQDCKMCKHNKKPMNSPPCHECYDYNSFFEWRGTEEAVESESITQSMPLDMRDRFRESYGGQSFEESMAEMRSKKCP